MANTVFTDKIFAKEVIRKLDRELVMLAHTNRKYEGLIKTRGDTVRVETLPTITFTKSSITPVAAVNAVKQVSTVTFTDGSSGDVYKVVINGNIYSLTDTGGTTYANATAIATAMATAMAGSTTVDVSSSGAVLTVTAKSAGTAFTIANTGSTTVGNVVIATTTANVVAVSGNTVGSGPGGVIAASDFAITIENLIIDSYTEKRVNLPEIEVTQSVVPLESAVAERFSQGLGQLLDTDVVTQILTTQVADIPAANKINEFAPVTLTASNVYEEIMKMRTALRKQNVRLSDMRLFIGTDVDALLQQSTFLVGSGMAADILENGSIGKVGGIPVYVTTALDSSKEMIMMAEGSVNTAVQVLKTKTTDGVDGFYMNVLAELVWGMKIFGENAKAISINYVA